MATPSTTVDLVIADGRGQFWQYDTEQYLLVTGLDVNDELHYDMPDVTIPTSFLVFEENGQLLCRVPDELLRYSGSFKVWAYVCDEKGKRTVLQKRFRVNSREEPPDYVHSEVERFVNFEEVEF